MPLPNLSSVHVNRPLTQMSIAYIQAQDKYVADKVFPSVPVANKSDIYFVFDKADFLRNEFGKKVAGGKPAKGGYDLTTAGPYNCEVYAYAHQIPDQIRSNADSPLNLDRAAAEIVMQKALIAREASFVTRFMGTGIWGKDITGVASAPSTNQVLQWDNASSNPIEDIRAGMTYVESQTGFRPNTLTMGRAVWDKLVDHSDLIDRVKYGGGTSNTVPAMVQRQAVAQILELDNIYVSAAVSNTAEKGATGAYSYLMGKSALLTYTPQAPSLMMPAAGLTFNWTGFLGSEGSGIRVKKYRQPEEEEADQIEGQIAIDQRLVGADLGYFFTSIIS